MGLIGVGSALKSKGAMSMAGDRWRQKFLRICTLLSHGPCTCEFLLASTSRADIDHRSNTFAPL